MKKNIYFIYGCAFVLFSLASCGTDTKEPEKTTPVKVEVNRVPAPDFNADSAYAFVKAQVDFGPRVPGTAAHAKCADYLVAKLKSYGLETSIQKGTVQTFDKKQFSLKNIIASFKPDAQSRILICSHWDTRPWADEDTKNADKPFDSANDGPSGVGVAMEVARQISKTQPNVGIDIIFFDLEDYGTSGNNESWCLGSQYWSKNLHKPNYYANFGILLDMVGGPNALFPKEKTSVDYASSAVDKVWKAAADIGYGNYFSPQVKTFVGIDDHVFVNKAGIPCIDIIEYNQATGGFGDYHHTHKDNMDIIDKNTLKAVGQTLLEVIYNEK
ncbi:MAG: M28 family peptidase [Bacteroidia bacterium]|jgi:Zn-dependent M28 family amino/carboxypeptidase